MTIHSKDVIVVKNLSKIFEGGFKALDDINLTIKEGEIFALLGPNGAGKTTLINIICGLVNKTSGEVTALDHDVVTDYRFTRSVIALVPQEITLDPFLTVEATLAYARGFYGESPNPQLIEETLKALSLWDKKETKVQELSGGMKRRVLIGKALMNEPEILFLDEPTAGVDVELRKGMWDLVWKLKKKGVTVILTTHYIEEAQEMADRIGIINDGKISLVEEKTVLMKKFGSKNLIVYLTEKIDSLPVSLRAREDLVLSEDGLSLTYTYPTQAPTGITDLLSNLKEADLHLRDVATQESSLEDIFVDLIHNGNTK